ncbi:DNA topoisomerase [Ruminococcus sp.]|uniref:DNA topoisomerase n=1 Tax=Ruminococcus sp. TaxID=41978 RepID=UPI00258F76EE|nr:DNA topoisomerase [Ruminococcus sp.]MCR5022530.1 type IA DNA topoisomerase [Ruminococcus sp.]
MVGILTEKNSAYENFKKALGGVSGIYNGEQFILTHAKGHLYQFEEPYKQVDASLSGKYKSWNIDFLPWDEKEFKWRRIKKPGADALLKEIYNVLSKCDEIVIATDDDPSGEGELLAWEILSELKLRPRKYSRMYFPDEAAVNIQKAFVSRKEIPSMDKDMDYIKALYRTKWDFISIQFTRIATIFGDGRSVLRQGRLKSAMVWLVGEQLKAVSEYKKTPFYQTRFKDENGNVYTNNSEEKYKNKSDVPSKYKPSGVVVDSKEIKSQPPGKLLDLAALSSILSAKGIKASELLATYQKMYEDQIVSYPRTEDKKITIDQFNELLPKIDAIANVVGVKTSLLTHRIPRKTHISTGCAHGANRPGPVVPKSLADLKKYGKGAAEIYTTLAKNYLAMLAEDYEYELQKGHIEMYPEFIGKIAVPKKIGYKAVFNYADDDEGKTIGKELGKTASPFIHEGFAKKPTVPTQKWLMKQLEKYDVGTGATRVSTYSEVTDESAKFPLLVDKKGKITMTQCGEMSYRILPGTNIGNIKITEQVMLNMKEIAAGKSDPEKLLAEIRELVNHDIEVMKKNGAAMRTALSIKPVEIKDKVVGEWKGKTIRISSVWGGHTFTNEELNDLFAGKSIKLTGIRSKEGNVYNVIGKLAEQEYKGHKFIGFQREKYV